MQRARRPGRAAEPVGQDAGRRRESRDTRRWATFISDDAVDRRPEECLRSAPFNGGAELSEGAPVPASRLSRADPARGGERLVQQAAQRGWPGFPARAFPIL